MINKKLFKNIGIVGFGAYVPVWRLKIGEIAHVWGEDAEQIIDSLGIKEKSVASFDEDCITMAYQAADKAVKMAEIKPYEIGAIFIGSESHPYSVKPSGVTVAQALKMDNDFFCSDLEFACKAGTTGIQIVASLLEAGLIDYGLAIGSDRAQAQPGDVLEYTAGTGAAALLLGKKKTEIKIQIKAFTSFTSDTPDFWRRDGQRYPSHSGRFTGEPGYFYHLENASQKFLKAYRLKPSDFTFAIFHLPNLKFPQRMAKVLGFNHEQILPSLEFTQNIGNTYSASSLLGLIATLKKAKAGQNIFLASYGSGAGSDVFWFKTTKNFKPAKESWVRKRLIDYPTYLRFQEVI